MKILFDTSVLLAAIVEPHPLHSTAFSWLKRARSQEFDMLVASHTLAELYAVLTTLPISPRITPGSASHLIHSDIETMAKIVSLSTSDYSAVIKRIANRELSGGVVYDALITRAAEKAGADKVLTFNLEDFKRVWPEGEARITAP